MVMMFPGGTFKAVTLSYDDGVKQDIRLAEIMVKYGLRGTFNINTGRFSEKEGERRMTVEKTRELITKYGMEIAAHGLYHRYPARMAPNTCTYEMLKDRENLEKLYGGIFRGAAYAYGNYDDDVVEIMKNCGYAYARTTVSTERFDIPTDWLRLPATCHHKNPRLMELAHKFLESDNVTEWRKQPQLFYLWGHSYEFDDCDNWNVIEEFAKLVGARDDVWYATNIEIYDYVTAFRSLVFSCDEKTVMNPTSVEVTVYHDGKEYVIKPGETTILS